MGLTNEEYQEIAKRSAIIEKFEYFRAAGYVPHEKQVTFHSSTVKKRVLVAGRRSGKSIAAAKEAECKLLKPGKIIWVVAPTYKLTEIIFGEVYQELIIRGFVPLSCIIKKSENERMIKIGWDAQGNPTNDLSKITQTSEIWGKSSDNPDSLLGHSLDLLIFDECAKEKSIIWEKYLSPTLTDRDGEAIFLTTPEGQDWVYELFQRGEDEAYPEWESFHFETADNPHISKEYLKEQERSLPAEVFNQEHKAQFTSFKGQVYKTLTKATHGIKRGQYPALVKVRLGIDFGFTNPTAILVVGYDHDGRRYILEEHYETGMHESDIVAVVKDIKEKYKRLYAGGVADSSEPDKVAALAPYGIMGVYKGKDSIKKGVIAMASAMKIQLDDKPRFYIDLSCTHCWKEMPNYRYKEQASVNTNEEPAKKDDHTCDAARYLIYSEDTMIEETTFSARGLEV